MTPERASVPSERIRSRDVARITGWSVRTVQERTMRGEVPGAGRPDEDSPWTYNRHAIQRWIAKGGHMEKPPHLTVLERLRLASGSPARGSVKVYFLQAGKVVKIGVARDVRRRMGVFRTGHHETLILLGTITGDQRLERALHRRFRRLHVRGEWFRLTPAIRSFIEQFHEPPP